MGIRGRDRQGQAALEYMVMISIALLISTPLILEAQSSVQDVQSTSRSVELQRAMDAMGEGARLVNSQGSPARTTFEVKIPSRVVEGNVSDQHIFYRMRARAGNQSFFRFFNFNVSGKLPTSQGLHAVEVKAVREEGERFVNISTRQ